MAGPTPDPIRYGHIAAALRQFISSKNMKMADFSEAMGLGRKSVTPYGWLSARGAPSAPMAKRLTKVTGLPASTWQARLPTNNGQTTALLAQPALPPQSHPNPVELVNISFLADGSARVRFNATMPTEHVTALLQTLTEIGVLNSERDHRERNPSPREQAGNGSIPDLPQLRQALSP